MAGRPPSTKDFPKILLRLSPALRVRIDHCQWLLQRQHGPKVTQTEALWRLLEAGCDALEQTLEGRETPGHAHMSISGISQIAPSQLSEIATIPGEDMAVPGYGFPEDADDDLPPAHGTNGTHAPASAAPVLQAAEAPSAAAAPVRTQTPTGQRSAWNKLPRETLQAIADERTHCEGLSHREFAQRLHEKGIYSATAKDGSKVPANHRRVSEWLERAREEGML